MWDMRKVKYLEKWAERKPKIGNLWGDGRGKGRRVEAIVLERKYVKLWKRSLIN